jgi:hypothetical protein
MNARLIFLTITGIVLAACLYGQVANSPEPGSIDVSPRVLSKYMGIAETKAGDLEEKLAKRSGKALAQLQKQEQKIQRKLARIDSLKANKLLGDAKQQYGQLEQRLKKASSLQQYIPSLDTLSTSLKFFQNNPALLAKVKDGQVKLKESLSKVNGLKDQFSRAEEIKKFLKERRQYLKEQLSQMSFAKELKNLNKQVYYYNQQLSDYKELLNDHKKIERKAIELLSKTKLFKDFMRRNNQLASLFRLPGDPDDPVSTASLAGLQTRAQVNNLIQQQIAAGGPNAQQQFQQNMQEAQSQLNQLKNKIAQFGGNSSEDIMPEGFKPNQQKTKSFLQRLEWGTNIQSQKANGYFPVTSDIGLSLGYKLNDKSLVGIGASYKMGWGQNIRNINITHQGVGIRSFMDWKIKGSFWVSGGYEMNYRNEFNRIAVLKDMNAWQQSGMIGISKLVSLKTKFFKKTKLQLLWDFLSYEQVPRTQALVFRVGYAWR